MQPKGIYKGYKLARKSLKAYSIKMQYEIVIKVIGCSCYTCLPCTALAAAQTAPKTAAPGTGTGASPVVQRLLTIATPKKSTYTHTYKQEQKLRTNIKHEKAIKERTKE